MRPARSCPHKRRRLDRAEDAYQCLDCKEWVEAPECAHGIAIDEDCDDCTAAAVRVSEPDFTPAPVIERIAEPGKVHPFAVLAETIARANNAMHAARAPEPPAPSSEESAPAAQPKRKRMDKRSSNAAKVRAAMPVVMELLRAMGEALTPFQIGLIRDIPLPVVNAALSGLKAQRRVRTGRPGTYLVVRRTRR